MNKVNLLNTILSHLSDAQFFAKHNWDKKAIEEINIAKAILLYIADDKTDIGKIDIETKEIDDMLKKLNLI